MSSERQEHNQNTPWWGEHIHRYLIAEQYLRPSFRVLDIACGNGFGSYMISKKTENNVTGADISEETILYCKKTFADQKNLSFELVDGTAMKFEDNYFDMIVSFETIEHTTEYKQMLSEFYRTLKKGGIALISTPNQAITSPDGIIINPYHTQEFNLEELSNILNATFEKTEVFGQQYIRYAFEKSLRFKTAKALEQFLYLRGVRKTPLLLQDAIMKSFIKKGMYPLPQDFQLTSVKTEIEKCKTFVAVCHKK